MRALVSILLLAVSPLLAESESGFRPGIQAATVDDSWALFDNPAGIAFVSGAEFVGGYQHEWSLAQQLRNMHHTQGIFVLGPTKYLSLGLGGNLVLPDLTNGGPQNGGIFGSLGIAFQSSGMFSVGLAGKILKDFSQTEAGPFLASLGTQVRPVSWFALGTYINQVYGGFFAPFETRIGMGVRPVKDLLTIGADVRFTPSQNNWYQRFQITPGAQVKLDFGGFAVLASVELPDVAMGVTAPFINGGLSFNFEHFGTTLIGAGRPSANAVAGFHMRVSSAKWTSLAAIEKKWMRFALTGDGRLQEPQRNLAEQFFDRPLHYTEVLASLKALAHDKETHGVIIKLDGLSIGFARAAELHETLLDLRHAQKKVVVYLEDATEVEYLVASAADQIYLSPSGSIRFGGFQKTLIYVQNGLQKLGVQVQAIAAGQYKSAPRTFTANEPSPEENEVNNAVLDEQVKTFSSAIQKSRGIPNAQIMASLNLGELVATEALDARFVDGLAYEDELRDKLAQIYNKKLPMVATNFKSDNKETAWGMPTSIAIIPVSGSIVQGSRRPGLLPDFFQKAYANDIIEAIQEAAGTNSIAAIVIRIDSPGGDALASDLIYRAALQARISKPVVASMGDVAASGGYYIAAGTQEIYAQNATLTGSIGVFTLHFSGHELAQKLGVSTYEIGRLKLSGGSIFRALNPAEIQRQQTVVNWHYKQFKEAVQKGQSLTAEHLDAVAEGRVWTGRQALDRKLVTKIGGLSDAIARAKELAKLGENESVRIVAATYEQNTNFGLAGVLTQVLGLAPAQGFLLGDSLRLALQFSELAHRPAAIMPWYLHQPASSAPAPSTSPSSALPMPPASATPAATSAPSTRPAAASPPSTSPAASAASVASATSAPALAVFSAFAAVEPDLEKPSLAIFRSS